MPRSHWFLEPCNLVSTSPSRANLTNSPKIRQFSGSSVSRISDACWNRYLAWEEYRRYWWEDCLVLCVSDSCGPWTFKQDLALGKSCISMWCVTSPDSSGDLNFMDCHGALSVRWFFFQQTSSDHDTTVVPAAYMHFCHMLRLPWWILVPNFWQGRRSYKLVNVW